MNSTRHTVCSLLNRYLSFDRPYRDCEGDGKLKTEKDNFIPALGFDRLTALYDPVVRFTTRERVFKKALTEEIPIKTGQRILDIACGTGTLTIMLKGSAPDAEVVGIDGDANILRIAREKIREAGADIRVEQGMSFDLPFADGTFDYVVASLFFHHLTRENKLKTLFEISRVLRSGGEFHVADWGPPANALTRFGSYFIRLLDGHETTADNFAGLLTKLIADAGFQEIVETNSFNSMFGTIKLHRSRKP